MIKKHVFNIIFKFKQKTDLLIITISFLEIFEENMNDNFDKEYQYMIFYCTYNSIGNNYTKGILKKENNKGIKDSIIKLISCINEENAIIYD